MIRPVNNQFVPRVRAFASTVACATLLASLLAVSSAHAATYTWTGSSSTNWSTSSNWSPNTVPGQSDEADFSGTFSNSPIVGNQFLGQFHVLGSLAESFTTY